MANSLFGNLKGPAKAPVKNPNPKGPVPSEPKKKTEKV